MNKRAFDPSFSTVLTLIILFMVVIFGFFAYKDYVRAKENIKSLEKFCQENGYIEGVISNINGDIDINMGVCIKYDGKYITEIKVKNVKDNWYLVKEES